MTSELATAGIGIALLNAGLGLTAGEGILASTVISSLGGFLVSTAVDAVGSRLFAPDKSTAAAVFKPGIMVRETLESHKIIYGQAKASGPIVFISTTNSPRAGTNGYVHIVIALAGHEVDSIGTVYFNETPVTYNATTGFVNSYPYWNSGTQNNQAIASGVRSTEVTTVTTTTAHGFIAGDLVVIKGSSDGTMDGSYIIASVPTSTTFTYSNGGPNSTSTGGTATDMTNASDTNGYARIKIFTGSPTQAASPDLMAEIPGWDSSHTLSGIAYLYARLEYNANSFGQGIPNISAIVKGKKVYDPRTGNYAWSNNPALCIRDYLISDYGFNCDITEINDTYATAAANHCDESITLTTGGTQNRYSCDGVIDTASAPIDNLNLLVAAYAGAVTYVQGQFRPYAGVYDATVGDLDTTMLAGTVKVHTRTTRQQLFNAVQGTYLDPSLNWQATDFPQVTNDTYTAADGGKQIFKDIQLPFTTHPEAAQRIAKVILEQGRQGIMLELTLNHLALPLAVFDTVTYTDPNLGWDHKVFRIRKLTTAGIGPIQLLLQEEASANYDWNSGLATVVDPAPDTNLPDPFTVITLVGMSISSRAVQTTTSGTQLYNLVLMWTLHSDSFVANGGRIEIQYKLHSDTAWRPSFFVNGDLTQADILSSSVNVAYDVRARAVNTIGAVSNWSQIIDILVGTSGGIGTSLDWGLASDSVGTSNDWDLVTDAVGTTNDWGSVA